MRPVLAAVAVWLACAAVAQAQRRVIHLESTHCGLARPRQPLDWVITPEDPCPGATLLRLCGGATTPGACPPIADAAASLGDAGVDRCAPDPALLPAADALYGDFEPASLPAALRLYRVLARVPSVRTLALFRAARSATRLSRYADAARTFAELLDTGVGGPLREVTVAQYAGVLVYDDHDENQAPDEDYPEAWLRPPFLPDAPWAREVAVRTFRFLVDLTMHDEARRALAVIDRRWARGPGSDLAEPIAQLLEHAYLQAELVEHAFAEARGCRTRHAGCEGAWLDRAQAIAVARLGQCGPGRPEDGGEEARLHRWLEGVAIGERLSELRPVPALALDTADAAAWVAASLARSGARIASTSPDASVRAQATARLAAAPPSAPPPLRTRVAPATVQDAEGNLDRDAVERIVPIEALGACIPRRPPAIRVRVKVAVSGAVTAVEATPTGRTADCVARAIQGLRAPAPEGGPATVDGLILLVPRAR